MTLDRIEPFLQPLRKSVTVARPPAEAFEIFTARMARWWPLAPYSMSQERAASCAIEPRPGGEVYEVRDDGVRCTWGRVLSWEPPRRFVLSWHPGREPETAQEVEVRFVAVPTGTRVELEHRGWQALGEAAAATRERYAGGWEHVGEAFVNACGA
jgi:uncharacterized protein YndB with AHSA1/START domain